MPSARVLTRRELNRALLERQLLLERKPVERGEGGRAARRPAGAVDDEPVSLAPHAPRGIRARSPRPGADDSPARQGAHPPRDAAHRHPFGLLGIHDCAPRAGRHSLAPLVRSTFPRRPAEDARGRDGRRARGHRADLQGGARTARAVRAAGPFPDVHLASHPGTGIRRARPALGYLGVRRPRCLYGRRGNGDGRAAGAGRGIRPARAQLSRRLRPGDEAGHRAVGGHPQARADHGVARAPDAANVPGRAGTHPLRPHTRARCPTPRPRRPSVWSLASTISCSPTPTGRGSSGTFLPRASSRRTGSCTRRSSSTASSPARGSSTRAASRWSPSSRRLRRCGGL